MNQTKVRGLRNWSRESDRDGHKTYHAEWLIERASDFDGPALVATTPGLPRTGAPWQFGNDYDPAATCQPDWEIRSVVASERGNFWLVDQKYSTLPLKRCQDTNITNPLMEPPKIGGTFHKLTKEATKDRHGKPIKSSSHEPIKREVDDNRPTVQIEFNTLILPLVLFAERVDTVNDHPMWGLQERMVKLGNVTWKRQMYGSCSFYYTVTYDFEINFKKWDFKIPDQGKMCLRGHSAADALDNGTKPAWALDPDAQDPVTNKKYLVNPKNFEVYKDKNGENALTLLDGKGRPLTDADNPFFFDVEYYDQANFWMLGIPTLL